MTDSKLYYEAHVTIEPVFEDNLVEVERISKENNFKVAKLLMKKREQDTETRSVYDTFTTGHSKNLEDIIERTKNLVITLKSSGFKVWRYKIEDTVLDSRTEDVLNLGVA